MKNLATHIDMCIQCIYVMRIQRMCVVFLLVLSVCTCVFVPIKIYIYMYIYVCACVGGNVFHMTCGVLHSCILPVLSTCVFGRLVCVCARSRVCVFWKK